jgi:hypothetical protein
VDLQRRSALCRDKPWDTRRKEGVTGHTRVDNDLRKGREKTRFTRDNKSSKSRDNPRSQDGEK